MEPALLGDRCDIAAPPAGKERSDEDRIVNPEELQRFDDLMIEFKSGPTGEIANRFLIPGRQRHGEDDRPPGDRALPVDADRADPEGLGIRLDPLAARTLLAVGLARDRDGRSFHG
jgi:hypothetical protein